MDTWIELHATLPRHKKLTHFMRMLAIPRAQAVGHLAALWMWAVTNVPDGNLSDCSDAEIAQAALWEGSPDVLCNALRNGTAPWIDPDGVLHDWHDYTGRLLQYREKVREQTRKRVADLRKRRAQEECNALGNALGNSTPTDRPTDRRVVDVNLDAVPTLPGAAAQPPAKTRKPASQPFTPPALPDVLAYFTEKGAPDKEGRKFWRHFENNGWKVGGRTRMRDWHLAAGNWIDGISDFAPSRNGNASVQNRTVDELLAEEMAGLERLEAKNG